MDIKKPAKKALYSFYANPLSKILYNSEIKKRSHLYLSEIIPLSQKINMFAPFSPEIHKPNDWYGHAKIFKKFLGLSSGYKFKFTIEHGTYLDDEIADIDLEDNLPSIITYSKNRADILRHKKAHVFSIGPFIHYAPDFLSENEFSKEKKRLGKNLLVFPMHSTMDTNFNFNITKLCRVIGKLGKDFNKIRICLYWIDVLNGHYKIYQDFGFECVTAGHILDPLFIPRLKSIIKLADYTISNGISTHVAYNIFLNKPHYIIPQKFHLSGNIKEIKTNSILVGSDPYKKILNAFSKPGLKISAEQRRLVDYYWGMNEVKTKKEFLAIVDKTESIYEELKKH
ncbi:MAG: hypothetical protein Q7R77_01720 [Candidatus Daviesbacteria bacterium]|nr:hypothetical protein [Candidatus Daviesbacteria bacterium]